jgi:hypothetical protein
MFVESHELSNQDSVILYGYSHSVVDKLQHLAALWHARAIHHF